MKYLGVVLLLMVQLAYAEPREIDDHHWADVERVIAIGDIHGDFSHYLATLEAAGLADSKGKWVGGQSHLVQTGDIPDRGPDTLKIIQHLQKLTRQARKKGGRVHSLIGNHEAMNVYGDLHYVTSEEFAVFAGDNSAALRERYFQIVMQNLQSTDPEAFAALPENYRETWDADHPLGWLEHRQAWSPSWNPNAELGDWVLGLKVAIQINDVIFLHGGISGFYCQNSLQSLTAQVVNGLRSFDPEQPGILLDEFGPLWYRGLSGREPVADPLTVEAILAQHQARHIVVGHTPTGGIIWPRYDGQVIQIDSGISTAYGGHVAFLEITAAGLFAGYPQGKIKLPLAESGLVSYVQEVSGWDSDNVYLQQLFQSLASPSELPEATTPTASVEPPVQTAADGTAAEVPEPVTVPICGISP